MQKSRKRAVLAFLPALVAIGVTAFAASGASVISGATAASTVGVGGSVSAAVLVDPTPTGGSGANGCADETLGATFATTAAVTNGCRVTFGTNSASGATVSFANANAGAFFCGDGDPTAGGTRNCALGSVTDAVGTGQTIAADSFAIALREVGADVTRGAGFSALAPTPAAAGAYWSGITASPVAMCATAAPSVTSTCDFVFAGQGTGASQAAGDYSGTLNVTIANN